MTEPFDPYRVLGVSRGADATAIRNAFRKLALQHHPDRNPGSEDAEERFKTIVAAYEILTDARLRERWNRRAENASRRAGFPHAPFQGAFHHVERHPARSRPGQDVHLQIELEAEEAGEGQEIPVRYTVRHPCKWCGGKGGSGRMVSCPTCLGWGKVRPPPGRFFGRNGYATDCPACKGTAYVFVTPCRACGGDGLVEVDREALVRVPAGVDSGKTFTLRGAGHAGPRGGVPGRLRVEVVVARGDSGKGTGDPLEE